jgi:hypothetical protein
MKATITMTDDGKLRLVIKKSFFQVIHDRTIDIINYPILMTEAYTFLTKGNLESSYSLKNKASGWLHWSLSFRYSAIPSSEKLVPSPACIGKEKSQ